MRTPWSAAYLAMVCEFNDTRQEILQRRVNGIARASLGSSDDRAGKTGDRSHADERGHVNRAMKRRRTRFAGVERVL